LISVVDPVAFEWTAVAEMDCLDGACLVESLVLAVGGGLDVEDLRMNRDGRVCVDAYPLVRLGREDAVEEDLVVALAVDLALVDHWGMDLAIDPDPDVVSVAHWVLDDFALEPRSPVRDGMWVYLNESIPLIYLRVLEMEGR
jgi:hypothetical protein